MCQRKFSSLCPFESPRVDYRSWVFAYESALNYQDFGSQFSQGPCSERLLHREHNVHEHSCIFDRVRHPDKCVWRCHIFDFLKLCYHLLGMEVKRSDIHKREGFCCNLLCSYIVDSAYGSAFKLRLEYDFGSQHFLK